MLRSLPRCIFSSLLLVSLLVGQGVADGQDLSSPGPGSAPSSPAAPPGSPQSGVPSSLASSCDALAEANNHYLRGEFDAAIQSYNVVLQKNPKSPDAYAGLVRTYLKQNNVDQAYETATQGVAVTNAPVVRVALGEVYFRQGKIPEAEREWLSVVQTGYPSARAYWGLSRVRTALSLYGQAKELLDKAHELDPADRDIQKRWIYSLSRAEQIQFWEKYLASPTNDDAETRADLQHHLEYLKVMETQPPHACRIVSHIPSAETNLAKVFDGARHFRGYPLEVALNGEKGNLLLDTGGSGILIDQVPGA